MAQSIQVNITIPESHILITIEEYNELREATALGTWTDINWLKEKTGIEANDSLKEKFLYPFRKELEAFTHYPAGKGDTWKFNKLHMEEWLENNSKRVWG